jgi:hypothetical protein
MLLSTAELSLIDERSEGTDAQTIASSRDMNENFETLNTPTMTLIAATQDRDGNR